MNIESSPVLSGLAAMTGAGIDKSTAMPEGVDSLQTITDFLNNPPLNGEAGEFGSALMQQLQLLTQSAASATENGLNNTQLSTQTSAQLTETGNGLLNQAELELQNLPQQTNYAELAEKVDKLLQQPDSMQELSALFGKQLPVAKKQAKEINLDETLQALSEVLGRINHAVSDTAANNPASPELSGIANFAEAKPITQDSQTTDTALLYYTEPLRGSETTQDQSSANTKIQSTSETEQVDTTQEMNPGVVQNISQTVSQNLIQTSTQAQAVQQPLTAEELANLSLNTPTAKTKSTGNSSSPGQLASLSTAVAKNLNTQDQPIADSADGFSAYLKGLVGNSSASETAPSAINGLKNTDIQLDSIAGKLDVPAALDQTVDTSVSRATSDLHQLGKQLNMPEKVQLPAMNNHVYSSEWNKELGSKILWMNNQNISSAELKLNPEHLGPISIRIDMQQEQANISFTSHNAGVREMLEASIPKLREMMGSQNLTLVDVNVSQQSFSGQGQNQLYQPSDQGQRQPGADSDAAGENNGLLDAGINPLSDEIEQSRALVTNGLVSVYA